MTYEFGTLKKKKPANINAKCWAQVVNCNGIYPKA